MSGRIPEETVEQIRQTLDIVEVIDSYVPLKKSGSEYKALSPFQKEKTPSFYVSPSKQIFKDFSSGHGGDVFKFIMLYENVEFPEAIRRLAHRAGIPLIEEANHADRQNATQREKLFDLHAALTLWWKKLLLTDPLAEKARHYLKSRHISKEMVETFNLGYAPPHWEATLDWASQKGYSSSLLQQAGLLITHESGKTYDRFRDRLIFPICDETSRVVGFSGRLLSSEAKGAKYLNSPETPLFIKSKILFGLDKTKRAILQSKTAILCEGQIDLIRCYFHGIQNVVAPQGTAFTEDHGRLLKRFADEAILCFDADTAGQNAAKRSVDLMLTSGLHVRIASMPSGEDPDSLLLKGEKESFEKILQTAPHYLNFLLEAACQEHDLTHPQGQQSAAEALAPVVKKMVNPVERERAALQMATRLQIPLHIFHEQIKQIRVMRPTSPTDTIPSSPSAQELEVAPSLRCMLNLALHHPHLIPLVQSRLVPFWIQNLPGEALLHKLLQTHSEDAWQTPEDFLLMCSSAEANFISVLLLQPEPIPAETSPETLMADLMNRMEEKWRRRRIQLLEQEIKSNLFPPNETAKKSYELMELIRSTV